MRSDAVDAPPGQNVFGHMAGAGADNEPPLFAVAFDHVVTRLQRRLRGSAGRNLKLRHYAIVAGQPQHAPPLEEDPAVSRRVDALAAPGGPLHGIL